VSLLSCAFLVPVNAAYRRRLAPRTASTAHRTKPIGLFRGSSIRTLRGSSKQRSARHHGGQHSRNLRESRKSADASLNKYSAAPRSTESDTASLQSWKGHTKKKTGRRRPNQWSRRRARQRNIEGRSTVPTRTKVQQRLASDDEFIEKELQARRERRERQGQVRVLLVSKSRSQ